MNLLLNDLARVWRWYPLGIGLGIPDEDLRMIECDYQRTEDRTLHTLRTWMKIDEEPSWSKVVEVLVNINERHVARTVAEKYGKLIIVKTLSVSLSVCLSVTFCFGCHAYTYISCLKGQLCTSSMLSWKCLLLLLLLL